MGRVTAKKNVILTEAGRAPWYRSDGSALDAFIVGIAGGSASGKTRVAQSIIRSLSIPWVLVVSQDSFYKSLKPEESKLAFKNMWDFDHPNALDFDVLRQCLLDMKRSRAVQIPVYSFEEHQRQTRKDYLYGAAVIIVEGILVLHDPRLRDLLDLKVFVQADSDLMLARRIRRDVAERGRDVEGILDQYLRYVKPSYDNFVFPSARHADIIVPGSSNSVAISLITTHIREKLSERSLRLRGDLYRTPTMGTNGNRRGTSTGGASGGANTPISNGGKGRSRDTSRAGERALGIPKGGLTKLEELKADEGEIEGGRTQDISGSDSENEEGKAEPSNLTLMRQTAQLKGIHTILRDTLTTIEEFVFFSDRLAGLVIEESLSLLPYREKEVMTKSGKAYKGKELDVKHLCGVSILRSGGCFEKSLRRIVSDALLGSMLIQSDAQTGEPLLYNLNLPACLKEQETARESHVLLLDSQVSTGAAAMMAIRVLLDHQVPESNIIVPSFLVSLLGVQVIHRAFPEVRIVTSAIDPVLEERFVFTEPNGTKTVIPVPREERWEEGKLKTDQFVAIGTKSGNMAVEGLSDEDEEGPEQPKLFKGGRQQSVDVGQRQMKRCFAILPGMGSFGDRYYGV